MATDAVDRFAFEDFTSTVPCDWTSPKIEVVFDDRLRAAWRDVTIRDIELHEIEPFECYDDDDGNELTPVPRCAYMAIPFGQITATRRTVDGWVALLGEHDLDLVVELETDDSAEIFAERDPRHDHETLRDRLSETADGAISWIIEDFARPNAELKDECTETGTSRPPEETT